MATKKVELIEIRPIELRSVSLRVVGDTPLIMHAWSDKARKEMLDKQTKKTTTKSREAKNPVEDFIRSMYWKTPMPTDFSEDGFLEAIESGARFCFPVTAFKQAAISGAYRKGWIKDKMGARGAFYIEGDEAQMVEIISDVPLMREDNVKVGMGTADLRYRGEFRNWHADLKIKYDVNGNFTLEQIINMFNAGGFACGVGEWRPERDGQYGMFHVESVE